MKLVSLGPTDRESAWRFCVQRPHEALFIAGWVHDGGLDGNARAQRGWLLGEPGGDPWRGLVWLSETGVTLPILTPAGLSALTELERLNPGTLRVLTGARAQLSLLFQKLELQGYRARLVKDQLALCTEVPPATAELSLDIATENELEPLVAASGAMAVEEAGDDPQGRNPRVFRQRIWERVARGRDYVHWRDGALAFKANLAALSPLGGLLEGIYTAPAYRRQGLARAGTGTLTRQILAHGRRALLHVNDDNAAALALYRALGFRWVLDTRTLFLE